MDGLLHSNRFDRLREQQDPSTMMLRKGSIAFQEAHGQTLQV